MCWHAFGKSQSSKKYLMKRNAIKLAVLSGFVVMATVGAKAQTSPQKPVSFWIRGGYNAANISTNADGGINDAKTLSTFHAGATVDIPVAPVLSVQTGLLLNGQGAKTNWYVDEGNKSDNYVKTKFNPLYLQVPVNLVAKLPVSENANFIFGAGPYAQVGVGGKSKVETSFAGVQTSYSDNIKFSNDDPLTDEEEGARYDRLKRFDAGINALAGFEVDRFMITANYGLGLTKINSTQSDNENDKNKFRTFSVGVGVRL